MAPVLSRRSRQGSAIKLLARGLGEAPPLAEEQFSVTLELVEMLAAWQARSWDELFSGQIGNPHAVGQEMRDVYTVAVESLEQAQSRLGALPEVALRELRSSVERAKAIQADFERRWPMFDIAELQSASERMEQGQFLSAEELRRELLGDD